MLRGREAPMDVDLPENGDRRAGSGSQRWHWLMATQVEPPPSPQLALNSETQNSMDIDESEEGKSMETTMSKLPSTTSNLKNASQEAPTKDAIGIKTKTLTAVQNSTSRTNNNNQQKAHQSSWNRPRESKLSHQDLPLLVETWSQVVHSVFIMMLFTSLLVYAIYHLYSDYSMKYTLFQRELLLENDNCQRQYVSNRCHPDTRVPALQEQCLQWEKCMHRDPLSVASLKISAHLLAEVVEEFVQSISYKSMVFLALLMTTLLLLKYLLPAGRSHSTFMKTASKTDSVRDSEDRLTARERRLFEGRLSSRERFIEDDARLAQRSRSVDSSLLRYRYAIPLDARFANHSHGIPERPLFRPVRAGNKERNCQSMYQAIGPSDMGFNEEEYEEDSCSLDDFGFDSSPRGINTLRIEE